MIPGFEEAMRQGGRYIEQDDILNDGVHLGLAYKNCMIAETYIFRYMERDMSWAKDDAKNKLAQQAKRQWNGFEATCFEIEEREIE